MLTAWDGDWLVGMIRVVSDNETVILIQDLLVLSLYRRQGIGSLLMSKTLNHYKDIRQVILQTNDDKASNLFYQSVGLKEISHFNGKCYVDHRKV